MKRDSKGRFIKKHQHRSTRARRSAHAGEARSTRRRSTHARRATARSYEAPRSARPSGHRSSRGRRSSRGGRSSRPVNIAIVQPNAREMRSTRGHRSTRHRRAREAPIMKAGNLALFGVGGLIGIVLADIGHRYVTGLSPAAYSASGATQPTYPTQQSGASTSINSVSTWNDYAQAANPGMYSIGVQLLIALAGFGLGSFAKAASLKAILYGVGFGSVLHLGLQIVNAYVLEPMFSKTDAGARMYQHEWNANGGFGSGTMAGPPLPANGGQMGAPQLGQPQGARGARLPAALASMRTAAANPFGGGAMGAISPGAVQIQPGLAAAIAGGATAPPQVVQAQPPAAQGAGPGVAHRSYGHPGGVHGQPQQPAPPAGAANGGGGQPAPQPQPPAPPISCAAGCSCAKCGGVAAMGAPPAPEPQPPAQVVVQDGTAWLEHPLLARRLGLRRAA